MFELGKKIDAFAAKTPVAVLVSTVLQRDLSPDRMDRLFHNTAGLQYEKTLLFSTVMMLMNEVCLVIVDNRQYKRLVSRCLAFLIMIRKRMTSWSSFIRYEKYSTHEVLP